MGLFYLRSTLDWGVKVIAPMEITASLEIGRLFERGFNMKRSWMAPPNGEVRSPMFTISHRTDLTRRAGQVLPDEGTFRRRASYQRRERQSVFRNTLFDIDGKRVIWLLVEPMNLWEERLAERLQARGLTAVITGGGSGIGAAISRSMALAGASRLIIADLNLAAAERVADQIALAAPQCCVEGRQLDVTDDVAVASLVTQLTSASGGIGFWFSNAGVNAAPGLGGPEEWQRCFGVNVLGHVNSARHVMPVLNAQGGGHFVVTASAAGLLTDFRTAPYSATKHAAVALAEWLSITYGGGDVVVSCVCPEGVRTGMTSADSAKAAAGMAFIEPEEVAEAVLTGLAERRFLILPHPRVSEFEQRRSGDRERWLSGMRKARARASEPATIG